jgi:transposase
MASLFFRCGGALMLARHAISDADWERIEHLLPGQAGQHGGVAKDNRRFIDAVLYVARTGIHWADLPERFGNHNSVWRRFDRWANKWRWKAIMDALRDDDLEWLILDSTAVRAHPCAAGAKKNGTGLADRTIRRLAAAGAGSEPKSTGA